MTTDAGNRYRDLVAQALDAAGAVDDDKELKHIAFERVLDHLLGNGQGQPAAQTQGTPAPTPAVTPSPERVDSSLATEQQRVDAAARYFQIEPDGARELFDLSGEEPIFHMNPNKLPKRRADAVRTIALLVGGVRTAVGLETGTLHIRQAAEDSGKLDPANFMTTLSNMDNIAVLGKKGSQNRLVRMRVTGAEAARKLAQQLVA